MSDEDFKNELESLQQEVEAFEKDLPKEWRNMLIRCSILVVLCIIFWEYRWVRIGVGIVTLLDFFHFSALWYLQYLLKRKLEIAKKL